MPALSRAPSLGTTLLLLALTFLGCLPDARAQQSSYGFYDFATRPGSALVEVQDTWTPVWCDAKTVAFQREAPLERGSRRWIEYHTLGEATFRTENLTEEGGLVACGRDGTERVMQRGGYVGGLGQFILVRTSDGHEVELAAQARLVSADRLLRNFIFDRGLDWEPALFEHIAFENARDGDFPQSRSQSPPRVTAISAPRYAVIHTAALSGDGHLLAYATRAMFHSGARREGPSLDLFLMRIGSSLVRRVRLGDVFDEDTRLNTLFFEGDRLVLSGASMTGDLVIATCSIDHATSVPCQMRETGLDGMDFKVAGLGSKGLPIIASRDERMGVKDRRACLFELSEANARVAPPSCWETAPPAPAYGMGDEHFLSMAPDRRHVAVLTRYRASPDSPPPAHSTWVVVPMSEFENN